MRQLLIQVILYNFQLIEQTPPADRSNISDVLESFLNFCALIAKKVPSAFDDPEIDCDKLVSYGKLFLSNDDCDFELLTLTNFNSFNSVQSIGFT